MSRIAHHKIFSFFFNAFNLKEVLLKYVPFYQCMAVINVHTAIIFFPEVLRMMIIIHLKADRLAHPMLTNHSIYIRTVLDSE